VDVSGRPRSRVLHPIWVWDGETLVGWVGMDPTSLKSAHLGKNPYVSCNYWTPSQDTCVAECRAELAFDDETRAMVWNLFEDTPPPVGYDPGGIGFPGWEEPTSPAWAVIRLRPWRLRVFPGSIMQGAGGEILTWRE
jgi:hypothetical protein